MTTTVQLSLLAPGTRFIHDSREWERGVESEIENDVTRSLDAVLCFPRYGGGIQLHLGAYLDANLQVSVL